MQSVVVSGMGISYTCSIALGGTSTKLWELLEIRQMWFDLHRASLQVAFRQLKCVSWRALLWGSCPARASTCAALLGWVPWPPASLTSCTISVVIYSLVSRTASIVLRSADFPLL